MEGGEGKKMAASTIPVLTASTTRIVLNSAGEIVAHHGQPSLLDCVSGVNTEVECSDNVGQCSGVQETDDKLLMSETLENPCRSHGEEDLFQQSRPVKKAKVEGKVSHSSPKRLRRLRVKISEQIVLAKGT